MDLLERERLIAALLGGLLIPVDLRDLSLHNLAGGRQDRDAIGVQHHDLAILDVLDRARLREKGWYSGGDELLPLTAANHQWALLASPDKRVRLLRAHRNESKVPFQLTERGPHGVGEVALVLGRD